MRNLAKLVFSVCFLLTVASVSTAASFVVQKIEVNGLQRVPKATVMNYLDVHTGERLDAAKTNAIIQRLYQTDFFTNIALLQQGNTLIVNVNERPTISAVNISGNKEIPNDKLNQALKKLGLEKGRFLSHATLEEVKQALSNQYYATGRYNVQVKVTQTAQSRNRVAIDIKVSEGAVAKVEGIKIIGNRVYSDDTLIDQMHLSTPGFTTFFTRKDEYSQQKLEQSENDITSYYMNHGYIEAKIDSTQVTITPDRKSVYLIFTVTEGPQYHFSGYGFSGKLVDSESKLIKANQVEKGAVFSRQKIIDSSKNMGLVLGDKGYAFANVNPVPKIDSKKRTVFINYDVKPGRKYYIRDIKFFGNDSTSQLALRHQFYEMEGSLYSGTKIHDSLFNLQQNTYINQQPPPQIVPVKVPKTNNQVDLDVKLAERLSAEFQLSLGYSQAYGFLISTGITQSNFMGTGKTVGFSINTSNYQKSFTFNYVNPYYTPDGVSRSISLFASTTSSDQLSIAEYNTDSYGFNVGYGFPLSVYSSLNLGYGFTQTILKKGGTTSSAVDDFMTRHGDIFDQLLLTAGWSYRSTDRPIMPVKGTIQSINLTLSAPVDDRKLTYYKMSYTHDWYQPLNTWFIFHSHETVGYGNGYGTFRELPFFQNYYAGGLGTQGLNRAYYPFSLGPQDHQGNQLGGNLLLGANLSIILPKLFPTPTVRTSLFVDGGNVFDTTKGTPPQYALKLQNMRYSYGVQLQWWTPLNLPLIFSFAEPINDHKGDQLDAFQFTIGTMY